MELALWSEFHTRTDCIHMRRFSWPEAQLEKQQYRGNPRCRPFDGSSGAGMYFPPARHKATDSADWRGGPRGASTYDGTRLGALTQVRRLAVLPHRRHDSNAHKSRIGASGEREHGLSCLSDVGY
jgi:hypothetical protein